MRGRSIARATALALHVLTAPCSGAPLEGITYPRHDLRLGFEITGVVADVAVEAGRRVAAGDVLIRLNSLDAEARLAHLRLRAESTFEIDAARAEWDLRALEHEQILTAHTRGGATDAEVKRSALQVERDRLAYELLRQRQQEARLQLRQAEINLDRYVLRAPRDGIVEEIAVGPGELVREATPVLRFVDLSTLRVETPTPAADADRLRVGHPASVDLDGPGSRSPLPARIIQVASVGDPASGLRKVTLEVENSEGDAAGCTVWVDYSTPSSTEAPPGRKVDTYPSPR